MAKEEIFRPTRLIAVIAMAVMAMFATVTPVGAASSADVIQTVAFGGVIEERTIPNGDFERAPDDWVLPTNGTRAPINGNNNVSAMATFVVKNTQNPGGVLHEWVVRTVDGESKLYVSINDGDWTEGLTLPGDGLITNLTAAQEGTQGNGLVTIAYWRKLDTGDDSGQIGFMNSWPLHPNDETTELPGEIEGTISFGQVSGQMRTDTTTDIITDLDEYELARDPETDPELAHFAHTFAGGTIVSHTLTPLTEDSALQGLTMEKLVGGELKRHAFVRNVPLTDGRFDWRCRGGTFMGITYPKTCPWLTSLGLKGEVLEDGQFGAVTAQSLYSAID